MNTIAARLLHSQYNINHIEHRSHPRHSIAFIKFPIKTKQASHFNIIQLQAAAYHVPILLTCWNKNLTCTAKQIGEPNKVTYSLSKSQNPNAKHLWYCTSSASPDIVKTISSQHHAGTQTSWERLLRSRNPYAGRRMIRELPIFWCMENHDSSLAYH